MHAALIVSCLLAAPPQGEEAALLKTFRDEFVQITPGTGPFPAELAMGGDAATGAPPTVRIRFARPFAMAKYEVPQNLWEVVMGMNPSKWKGARNSVEMLSYDEAVEFCSRVTARLREAQLIAPTQTVRLPSEAEWEYCTRAGTTTRYSFGDDVKLVDQYGWHTGNAAGNDPPVGAKAANPWGLHDVHGYLWEWCADVWGDDLSTLPTDGTPRRPDPTKPAGEPTFGVLRGGSWKDAPDKLTSDFRLRVDRTIRDDAVGLRCVLSE